MEPPSDPSPERTPSESASEYFESLVSSCAHVSNQSLAEPNLSAIAASHEFTAELQLWCEVLEVRRETELLKVAALEYEFGLLALVQGHYRNAFKSLRLVLELTLQAIHLSSNELVLREWLTNRVDTSWSAIVDQTKGIFSERFAKAFFPDLEKHIKNYGGMAVLLYRECSECVHGNIPRHISLPPALGFDQGVFDLWHAKSRVYSLIAHFSLTLRYFWDLSPADKIKLKPALLASLTQIEEIRVELEAL